MTDAAIDSATDSATPSPITLAATVLGAPDPQALGRFYLQLLGWAERSDEPGWYTIGPPGGGAGLSFQHEAHHRRPAWPAGEGQQQMQLHLDLRVEDLGAAVHRAEELGATVAEFQPQEGVRVCLDPAGHPFCLFVD